MWNYFVTGDGEIGFGFTSESAELDLKINQLRHDITKDSEGVYLKRRKELSPWMPTNNILHISGVGCLVYEGLTLTEVKSGRSVTISRKAGLIFYYLGKLFGNLLSYTDIMVVLRPELDRLFQNISTEFTKLENFPYVMLKNAFNGFKPNVTYTLDTGHVIGVDDDMVGIKVLGEDMYHVADIDDAPIITTLAYIGYKLGLIIYEGVLEYGKID